MRDSKEPLLASPHNYWPEFIVPWDDVSTGPTDMSFLLHKPAGAQGFVRVENGHLVTGDGSRWRVWGHMFSGNAAIPSMEQAPIIARRFAKFGLNCVRLHHIDHRFPDGIIIRHSSGRRIPGITIKEVAYRDDEPTRALDPEGMARLDWFIYQCKLNGIYIDLNLNVSRAFTTADGVREASLIGLAKGLVYFDQQLIRLQYEYAQQVLDHYNPFTRTRYADEPAIAIIELVNENSLLEHWVRGLLTPMTGPERLSGAWAHIPPSYAQDLDKRWNSWLTTHYPDRASLLSAWQGDLREYEDPVLGSVRRLSPPDFSRASTGRFRDEARFLAEIEEAFFRDYESYLRGKIGVRQLIIGTSDHGGNGYVRSSLPSIHANALLDILDGHYYWQYVRPIEKGSLVMRWDNTPMVDDPDRSSAAQLPRIQVKGKPFIVSECNEHFPHDYACEFIPITTAYGLLNDWDGIIWTKYRGHYHAGSQMGPGPSWPWETQAVGAYLDMYADPTKMSQLAINGLMWHRGDLQAAREVIERTMTYEWMLDSCRVVFPERNKPYWIPWLPGRLSLVHRTCIADFDGDKLTPEEGAVTLPTGKIVSDTGELIWEECPADGRVLIDSPRHQGVVMRQGERATTNLVVKLSVPFAAVQLASLDERSISQTDKMLLVATARVANTGMAITRDVTGATFGTEWGLPPTRIEPVCGTVLLRQLEGAQTVIVEPLDGRGQPLGTVRSAEQTVHGFVIELRDEPATVWYMVTVGR